MNHIISSVESSEGKLANCTWGKIEDRDPYFQAPEERALLPALPDPFTEKADVWKLANMTQFRSKKFIYFCVLFMMRLR